MLGIVNPRGRLGRTAEIAAAFLKIGCVAFGGPAAHLALLESEFVSRRRWIGRQRFLDLMGATNLIPGPNSTEMTMHLGYERAGWLGLAAAGVGFVLPAASITALLAWLYAGFGELPSAEAYLSGLRPAVLVLILGAVWKLGRKAVANVRLGIVAAGVALAVLAGLAEIPALLLGGLLGGLLLLLPRAWSGVAGTLAALCLPSAAGAASGEAPRLADLGWAFFKVGCALYGSGYVLVAFLDGALVDDFGWVTQQQLLDAIAVGQFTPGPVLTAATFLGYLVAGWAGAAVATAGIFLPAFGFAGILNPFVSRIRQARVSAAFLDAINASAIGLMAAVAVSLAPASLSDALAWAIALGAGAALFMARLPAPWVIAGAGVLGLAGSLAGLT